MSINTLVQEKILDFAQMEIPQVFQRDLSLGRIFPQAIGNLVTVIVGARRSGKTFRLYQQMQQIVDMGYSPCCTRMEVAAWVNTFSRVF